MGEAISRMIGWVLPDKKTNRSFSRSAGLYGSATADSRPLSWFPAGMHFYGKIYLSSRKRDRYFKGRVRTRRKPDAAARLLI
jgi:hypothetical protein